VTAGAEVLVLVLLVLDEDGEPDEPQAASTIAPVSITIDAPADALNFMALLSTLIQRRVDGIPGPPLVRQPHARYDRCDLLRIAIRLTANAARSLYDRHTS